MQAQQSNQLGFLRTIRQTYRIYHQGTASSRPINILENYKNECVGGKDNIKVDLQELRSGEGVG
jgi:hypothetical protein